MVNKNAWRNNFAALENESQLEVAETIAEELRLNEEFHLDAAYDVQKSKAIRAFLEKLVKNAKTRAELDDIKAITEKFEGFSEDVKDYAISEILDVIVECVGMQEAEDNRRICDKDGHIFGQWTKLSGYPKAVFTINSTGDPEWIRMCDRCSFVERTKENPLELIKARNNTPRQTSM